MKEIFVTKRRGDTAKIRQILAVYSDGKRYRLHFTVLDRSNPSNKAREYGEKETRSEILNQEFFINCGDFIRASDYPLPKLAREFIQFLKESDNNAT
ncbi:hypothetical protein WB66_23665 [bacteria symbiont BFo1 of Frankliniella occidentalis]|uniref:hypothetical protein n=1 Tax=Erwinia aphidicola TaxID=68334 RepID=UPI0006646081|nr:hypothetical protein [Erwinia aphidicola]KYP82395.1 hypothetical protein WB66_23665 [bacteria symbiont BFo1 of Frankliniella occidentalis]KYP87059.1 hypothetical protein WB91_22420 [bacteria symbiont BFo1 of Frankliniella occidentalis]CAH0297116.1 hypothetical protein SRABI13_04256 [Erwinia aphidicola]